MNEVLDFLVIITKVIHAGHKKILKTILRLQEKNNKYCILGKRLGLYLCLYFINHTHTAHCSRLALWAQGRARMGSVTAILGYRGAIASGCGGSCLSTRFFQSPLLSQVDVSGDINIDTMIKEKLLWGVKKKKGHD